MWDMQQDRGYEPKLGGGRTPTSEAKPFNSEAEVVEMMNDPATATQVDVILL